MKNKFEIIGDTVYIVVSVTGRRPLIKTLIDVDDLELVASNPGKWGVTTNKYSAYVYTSIGDQKVILLHRYIMNTPPGMVTDHLNGNGLDNRRSNLRVTTGAGNLLNRRRRIVPGLPPGSPPLIDPDARRSFALEMRRNGESLKAIGAMLGVGRQQAYVILRQAGGINISVKGKKRGPKPVAKQWFSDAENIL